jgi:hypothetical protein
MYHRLVQLGVEKGGKGGCVIEGSLPDVEPARSDVIIAGPSGTSQPRGRRPGLLRRARQSSPEPSVEGEGRIKRQNPRTSTFRPLRQLWIPLVVLAVIGAGGLTVSRLHGVFGSEKPLTYGDTRTDVAKPFNPKHLTYEIFGPPGTVAQISFFDSNGDPKFIQDIPLPWSLDFPISATAGIGSIAAQGDTGSIGCRILVDGAVKAEKTKDEASAFISCMLKAA